MKLSFRIVLKASLLVTSLIVLSKNVALSSHFEIKRHCVSFFSQKIPATVKRVEKENTFVYSFQPLSAPEQSMLDRSIERFRQVKGFVSLSVNAQNEIELTTTKIIEEKESGHLLLISARLYGYIGYQITR